MTKVLVITNYNAGRKQGIKYKKDVLEFFIRHSFDVKFISVEELLNFDISPFDILIGMGGDGTISKLVPYVINTNKKIGIIPMGTANLLASSLKLPSQLEQNLQIILAGNYTDIDVIQINDKFSVLRAGFGYDSDIICKTPQKLKNIFGYFSYFVAGILFALRLKKKTYEICYNNEIETLNSSCLIFANAGNMYKNRFNIAQNNRINDGLIDIFVLNVTNPIVFFFEFLKIGLNIHKTTSNILYKKASNITLENSVCTFHIDGEKTKIKGDIKINILPKSVKFMCNGLPPLDSKSHKYKRC